MSTQAKPPVLRLLHLFFLMWAIVWLALAALRIPEMTPTMDPASSGSYALIAVSTLLLGLAPLLGKKIRSGPSVPGEPLAPLDPGKVFLAHLVTIAVWEASGLVAYVHSLLTGTAGPSYILTAAAVAAIFSYWPKAE